MDWMTALLSSVLARETEAAQTFRLLEERPVRGYAGSWFDGDSLTLNVAISSAEDSERIHAMGANPVPVARSLEQLEDTLERIAARERTAPQAGVVLKSYIDYQSNRVVLGVAPGQGASMRSQLRSSDVDLHSVDVVEVAEIPEFSTGAVRAADGTRNLTWQQQYNKVYPCSVGASVEGGYVTAGHCGYVGNNIGSASGQALGTVRGSALAQGKDSGWVETNSNWQPQPHINGYADGTISVAAKWSGMNEAPVGSTVCRYGQTSGGPDCGTIVARNQTRTFSGGIVLNGITQASGICTNDGDSGGPYVAAGGQIQGTNIGGSPTNTCPQPANEVYFQPIRHTLQQFGRTMLTAHGRNRPTVAGFRCPDLNNSGSGMYSCKIDYYNSQGATTLQWSPSGWGPSNSSFMFGSCVANQYLTVTFTATNPYGSSSTTATFRCPGGIIP
jgi:streptogrisin C